MGRASSQHWPRDLAQAACDFLFPPACLLCGRPVATETDWCGDCRKELGNPAQLQCPRCAADVGAYTSSLDGCYFCHDESFAFRRVLALGRYEGHLQRALRMGKTTWGAAVSRGLTDLLLERHLADLLTESFDAIVPVPHHWWRRMTQLQVSAETIAQRLADRLSRRFAPHILRKPRLTPRQAGASTTERRRQQRGAFVVPDGVRLDGSRLLLVDDVLTTGATADAAARALRQAGAADVLVVVLARGLGRDVALPVIAEQDEVAGQDGR